MTLSSWEFGHLGQSSTGSDLTLDELRRLSSILLREVLRLILRPRCLRLLVLNQDLDVLVRVLRWVLDVPQLSVDVRWHVHECSPVIQYAWLLSINRGLRWLSCLHLLH